MARCDHFFRKDGKGRLRMLLDWIYELDVLESVAVAARQYQLSFPRYDPSPDSKIQLERLFHPLLSSPVSNDFNIQKNTNLGFITGANMSGKSTFLKSFGLAVYLAHLGFPVPARKMETTIFNGLITTINLSDNINQGYSHFYSEVKRIKMTALKIKEKKKIVVIFDELFRGTNLKDASDASLLITAAFSRIKNSLFLISTHIVEIADELKKQDNIFFACFDSKLEGETPTYSYSLKTGVSRERVGLLIVRNEQIVELLDEAREE
jgi:DNA mismatch repair protein MutS